MRSLVPLAALMFFAGCSHTHPRGTVITMVTDGEVIAHLGRNDVAPGDKVGIFRTECREVGHGKEVFDDHCTKAKVGTGEVIRMLSGDFSVVRVAKGVPASNGLVIEKE